jgi:DNA-binding transcriptional LysR family regulator
MPFRRGQLRYFVTVAEEGQITRAAKKLNVAQPTLSHAIAQLEGELGLALLERHPRGVTLTPAGEKFYEKARVAVAATDDAARSLRSLSPSQGGTIEFGFVGTPPGLDSPAPLEAFAATHPGIDIRYSELPFPSIPTTSWLSEVDMAVCHRPPAHPEVWTQVLRLEPRVVLAPARHPLASRHELSVADVIDETFVGLHPTIEPAWAGFWSLDDHRGGPPPKVTVDQAANAQEVLAALAVRRAITLVPATVAGLIPKVLTGVVAIPLRDAEPAAIMFAGHAGRQNPAVAVFTAFARNVVDDDPGDLVRS